jgi:predicted acylesterase/phospholipase RssA
MDSATGEATVIDTKATRTPVLNVIKAALAMPVLYNKTVEVENKQCMDGGFRIPFPLQQAIDNGCTDILILLSRSENFCTPKPSLLTRFLFDLICARGSKGLNEIYAQNHIHCRAARDLAFGRTPSVQPGVNIAVICLERSERVQQLTVNARLLRDAAISYGRRTLRAFGVDGRDWNLGPASAVAWNDD